MTNVWSRFARQPMEGDRGCFKLFIRRNVSAAFKKTSALIYAEDETIWRADRNYGLRWHSGSGIPTGLPVRQPLRNERRTFLIVAAVQNADVVRIGAASWSNLTVLRGSVA